MELKKYRIIKYPGAKWASLGQIYKIWNSSNCNLFVDLFGGSGNVSLNVKASGIIYNDLNQELVNLFRTIKFNYGEFYEIALKNGNSPSVIRRFRGEGASSEIENAFATFLKFNSSFGGMGDTYGTRDEKGKITNIMRAVQQLPIIKERLLNWEIVGEDFRNVVKKYDDEKAFFYIDPPYPGKQWYDNTFSRKDMKELLSCIKSLKGKYLVNIDNENTIGRAIFGNPQFVVKYPNRNGGGNEGRPEFRYLSFYTNVGNESKKS